MKFLFISLILGLQAVAHVHNNFYPNLQDAEAIGIFRDYLVTNGLNSRCHKVSGVATDVKWQFHEHQGQLVADAVGDNFITRTSSTRSFRATVGPRGNVRIWAPLQVYYWLNLRQQYDEYKVDVTSSGDLRSYEESDAGPTIAGGCTGVPPAPGKVVKLYKAKPEVEEPITKPAPARRSFIANVFCPFENSIAKDYLLFHEIKFTIPHNYRENDVPMVLNLVFRERQGKLYAKDTHKTVLPNIEFMLEGANYFSEFPVEIGECEDSDNGGKNCPVQIRFPKNVINYFVQVPSRQRNPPPNLAWDCIAQSEPQGWFGFKMPCQVEEVPIPYLPDETKFAMKIPMCKLEKTKPN